ncbi:MAG: nicotinamide-nucleotide amidohydrolase family protein [Lactobacillaceae bacterium]|jgi:PncC family amidohydrolase|nr:nicotinamide-nucleotide amidohydrolase family protein [Lactobacillaceae bacterium]
MTTIADLGRVLLTTKVTITAAESLTAGLFTSTLAEVSGISEAFPGAFVTYSPEAKTQLVGVPPILVEAHGVVSAPVAEAMARGAQKELQTDWAISFTGVAGPENLDGHPAGTVYIGIVGPKHQSYTEKLHLTGDRQAIRQASVQAGIDLMYQAITKTEEFFAKR